MQRIIDDLPKSLIRTSAILLIIRMAPKPIYELWFIKNMFSRISTPYWLLPLAVLAVIAFWAIDRRL